MQRFAYPFLLRLIQDKLKKTLALERKRGFRFEMATALSSETISQPVISNPTTQTNLMPPKPCQPKL